MGNFGSFINNNGANSKTNINETVETEINRQEEGPSPVNIITKQRKFNHTHFLTNR